MTFTTSLRDAGGEVSRQRSDRPTPSALLWRRPASRSTAVFAPEVILDLSRLLSRVLHPTPTGVDRVEMAYAQTLLRLAPERLSFAAVHPSGGHGRLSTEAVRTFLDATAERWSVQGGRESEVRRWARALCATTTAAPLPRRRPPPPAGRVYLHLSARALERATLFSEVLRRERALFIPFVHDLIPLQFPEFARPNGASLYRRKLATVARLAAGVLVNSQATAQALQPFLVAAGRPSVPIRAAVLGAVRLPGATCVQSPKPYFVAVGTIEPRKNHLLLLNLWRRLAELQGPDATPNLVLVGRRGWENENILDLLDRSPLLRRVVLERPGLADRDMGPLVAGAQAALIPSFAEGYGLPVVEALSLGTPVIASDLPALREAGGDTPEFLDPLDGPAWMRAVLDYASPGGVRRLAQLDRLSRWRAPSWDDHVRQALGLIDEVCLVNGAVKQSDV